MRQKFLQNRLNVEWKLFEKTSVYDLLRFFSFCHKNLYLFLLLESLDYLVSLQVSSVPVSPSIVFKCKEMNCKKWQFVSVSKIFMKHYQNIYIHEIMTTTWLSLVLNVEHIQRKKAFTSSCLSSKLLFFYAPSFSWVFQLPQFRTLMGFGMIQIWLDNLTVKFNLD